LAFSTLSQIEKIDIITNVREIMAAYKDQLTGVQIENFAYFLALLEK
jgi:hypothetical protein